MREETCDERITKLSQYRNRHKVNTKVEDGGGKGGTLAAGNPPSVTAGMILEASSHRVRVKASPAMVNVASCWDREHGNGDGEHMKYVNADDNRHEQREEDKFKGGKTKGRHEG